MWNTAAIFKVTVAIVFGLLTAWIYRRWFPNSFWQIIGLCAVSSAFAIFFLDTFGSFFVPLPGNIDEHVHDKTLSVMRSLALGSLVFLVAANYKLVLVVADLFLFKIPFSNKQ